MVTVPHNMVGLERMLDYRGVGLQRFHCAGRQPTCSLTILHKTFSLVIVCAEFISLHVGAGHVRK